MAEMVNHPKHYQLREPVTVTEALDVIEAWNLDFHLGNAVKYILRAGLKHNAVREDLEKAVFYINRKLERMSDRSESK